MPDPVSAMVGSAVVGGVSSHKSGKRAEKAGEKASDATLQTAREAEALNRERFGEAQQLMMPSIGRADIASQQLMAELGLPQYQAQGQYGAEANEDYGYAPGHEFLPSTSYMDRPGYKDLMSEQLGAVEQTAATSGSTLYGGRRLKEAGKVGGAVQQSFYNNYMNMLQNMSGGGAATNLASLGTGQAATVGQQNIAATGAANRMRMEGVGARNEAMADMVGGGMGMLSGAMEGGYI